MSRLMIRCAALLILLIGFSVAAARGLAGGNIPPRTWLAWWHNPDLRRVADLMVWDGERIRRIAEVRFSTATFFEGVDAGLSAPKWSNDGRLAWSNGFSINVWDGTTLLTFGSRDDDLSPVWSHDGRLAWAAIGRERRIMLWNGGDDEPTVLASHRLSIGGLSWSYDGRLAWAADGDIFVWDGNTMVTVSQPEMLGEEFSRLVWSRDGRLAWDAYESPDATTRDIFVWDGVTITKISQSEASDTVPAWASDGRLAWEVGESRQHTIVIWNHGVVSALSSQSSLTNLSPMWSHDDRLAWMNTDSVHSSILVWNGGDTMQVSSGLPRSYQPNWSADGWLAWVSPDAARSRMGVYIWDGSRRVRLGDGTSDPVWSPPLY